MTTRNILIVLIGLLALSFFHQEMGLRAEKRLEAYKKCLGVYSMINFINVKDYHELCGQL